MCTCAEYTMVPSVYRKISVSCSAVHMLFPTHYTIHRQCRKMSTIYIVHTMVSQYNRNINGGSNHSVNIQKYVNATRTS
jgi:hypothetical protein